MADPPTEYSAPFLTGIKTFLSDYFATPTTHVPAPLYPLPPSLSAKIPHGWSADFSENPRIDNYFAGQKGDVAWRLEHEYKLAKGVKVLLWDEEHAYIVCGEPLKGEGLRFFGYHEMSGDLLGFGWEGDVEGFLEGFEEMWEGEEFEHLGEVGGS